MPVALKILSKGEINMKRLIGIFVAIVFALSLLPIFIDMSDDYNVANTGETFAAVEVLATPEVVTVSETPTEVTKVTVEGVELTVTTEYTVSGSNITILANNSETDDVIVVYYTYDITTTTSQDTLVDLIPTLIIILIVGTIAFAIYKGKTG